MRLHHNDHETMDTPTAFDVTSVPQLHCAIGAASHIGRLIAARFPGARRALIVTDGDLQAAGLSIAPRASLEQAGLAVSVYSGVIASPPEAVLRHAVDFARDHRPDIVIGIGGGSALDVAKLTALLTASGRNLAQLMAADEAGERLPLVLMPSLPCGAQASSQAYITNPNGNQFALQARQLLPDLVVLDAGLSVDLPAPDTAASGMLAIAQAIGAYTSACAHPLSDLAAREAITLISRHLLACIDNGGDLAARHAVLLGAHLAGQAKQNAPAPLLRALATPLVTLYQVSYAEAVTLMLPHLLRVQLDSQEQRLAELAAIAAPHVTGSSSARAEALVVAMQQLAKTTGLASSLESVGVAQADLERLADEAMLQWPLLSGEPCPVTRAGALALYSAAL